MWRRVCESVLAPVAICVIIYFYLSALRVLIFAAALVYRPMRPSVSSVVVFAPKRIELS